MKPLPCPSCMRVPEPRPGYWGLSLSCSNCYEAEFDSQGPYNVGLSGDGKDLASVIADWNGSVESSLEAEEEYWNKVEDMGVHNVTVS